MRGTSLVGDTVGLVTLDPGVTTGYTEGIYELDRRKKSFEIVAEGILAVKHFRTDLADEPAGAAIIARRILKFMAECNMDGIPLTHFKVAYEDYIPRPHERHGGRELLSPVRMANLLIGMLYSYKIEWIKQQPSMAKGKATTSRLRRHGLWLPNLGHGMDATRHAVLWVDKALS